MPPDTKRAEAPHGGRIQSIQHLRLGRRFLQRPRYHIVVDRDPQG